MSRRPAVPAPRAESAIPPAVAPRVAALLREVAVLRDAEHAGEAVPQLREAVALAPAHHDIRLMLARACMQAGDMHEAMQVFNEIARRFPERSDAWNNLAGILVTTGHVAHALRAVERAIALDPANTAALTNLAEACKATGDWPGARDAYAQAIAVDPANAKLHMQHGMTLITLGDWARGWREYEWRFRVEPLALGEEPLGSPVWDGRTPPAGRTVVLGHEQGLGDAIMCLRFARLLAARGARVIARVPPPLRRLAAASLSDAAGIEVQAVGTPIPAHDCHVNGMSVPAALGLGVADLDGAPYLAPVGDCPPAIAERLPRDGVPTVALAWAGNPKHINDRRRSLAGELLAPLLAIDGVRFVSLQKHPATADVLPAALRPRVVDLAPHCGDLHDTAHVLARCDLAISVDSAVAHLAGALGTPVLTCLPAVPDYRWLLERRDTPWYRSMTLLRQPAPFAWEPVLATVEAVVRELAAARAPRAVA